MAAWVLNLDADYELAAGSGYEPRRAVLLAMKPHVDALAARLLGPDDVVITDGQDGKGMVGRAWSPTPARDRDDGSRGSRAGAFA